MYSSCGDKLPKFHRTIFNDYQLLKLEEFYKTNSYPTLNEKYELAYLLNLERAIVQVWFNNRRAKDKRSGIPIPQKKKKKSEEGHMPNGYARVFADMYANGPNYRSEVFMQQQYPAMFRDGQFVPDGAYYTVPNNVDYVNYKINEKRPRSKEAQNQFIHHLVDRSYATQEIPRQVSVQESTTMPAVRLVNFHNHEIQQTVEMSSPFRLERISQNVHNSDHEMSGNMDLEMISSRQENHESREIGSFQELNHPRNHTSNSADQSSSSPKVASETNRIDELSNDEKLCLMAYRMHIISNLSKAIGSPSSDGIRNTITLRIDEETSYDLESEYGRQVESDDEVLLFDDNAAADETEVEADVEGEDNVDELDALFC